MTTELEKKVDPKHQALVDTVRKAIFPTATDAELALFFHKCNTVGINPLDQLIHPVKYTQKDGTSKVTFITSINLLRSKSDETGTYDGMDEPEFEGESEYKYGDESYTAPDLCRVKVYRKDIGRPFVGVARWKEYYPGDQKGMQYRQRPNHMLAKCAEALARRLAWPDKLNQLYTQEEMASVTEQIAGVSSKPKVNPDDVRTNAPEQQESKPGAVVGVINAVAVKDGTGKKGPWKRFGVTIDDQTYGTFDLTLGALATSLKGKTVEYTWEKNGEHLNLLTLEAHTIPAKQPETRTEAPKTGQATSNPSPAIEDATAFASTLVMVGSDAGLKEAKISAILLSEFDCSIDTVPAELQAKVLARIKNV